MSKFGWSLPAGVTTLPGEEEELLLCAECGEELPGAVDRVEPWEAREACDGRLYEEMGWETVCGSRQAHEPHERVVDAGETLVRICGHCKAENRE